MGAIKFGGAAASTAAARSAARNSTNTTASAASAPSTASGSVDSVRNPVGRLGSGFMHRTFTSSSTLTHIRGRMAQWEADMLPLIRPRLSLRPDFGDWHCQVSGWCRENYQPLVMVWGKEFAVCERSLWLFSIHHRFRKRVLELVVCPYFDRVILALIFLNSLLMAAQQPRETGSAFNAFVEHRADPAFTVIFTLEMVVKVIAYGLCLDSRSYLREPWNWLDFSVVITGLLAFTGNGASFMATLRVFRVLRPLRSLQRFPQMKFMAKTVLRSIPRLRDVTIITIFFFLIFGIVGISLWGGIFYRQCRTQEQPSLGENGTCWSWPTTGSSRLCGGSYMCEEGEWCGGHMNDELYGPKFPDDDDRGLPWCDRDGTPITSSSKLIPESDFIHFDHIGGAILVIFQSMTMEGWTVIMHSVEDSYPASFFAIAYFKILIFAFSFFVLNVALAVIQESFIELVDEDRDGESGVASKNSLDDIDSEANLKFKSKSTFFDEVSDDDDNMVSIDVPLWWDCRVVRVANEIVYGETFINIIMFFIFLNCLTMALERYPPYVMLGPYLDALQVVYLCVFTIEMVFMITALGLKSYVMDPITCFDGIVVIVSFVETLYPLVTGSDGGGDSQLSAFRGVRLMRILVRVAKKFACFRVLLKSMLETAVALREYFILFLIMLYIFSLCAMSLFANKFDFQDRGSSYGHREERIEDGNLPWCRGPDISYPDSENPECIPRSHFDTFLWALVTIFQIMTGESWNAVMYQGMRVGWGYVSFFFCLIVVGQILTLNLFLTILLYRFEECRVAEELREKQRRKAKRKAVARHVDGFTKSFSFGRIGRSIKEGVEHAFAAHTSSTSAEQFGNERSDASVEQQVQVNSSGHAATAEGAEALPYGDTGSTPDEPPSSKKSPRPPSARPSAAATPPDCAPPHLPGMAALGDDEGRGAAARSLTDQVDVVAPAETSTPRVWAMASIATSTTSNSYAPPSRPATAEPPVWRKDAAERNNQPARYWASPTAPGAPPAKRWPHGYSLGLFSEQNSVRRVCRCLAHKEVVVHLPPLTDCTICVANISDQVQKNEVEELLKRCGKVEKWHRPKYPKTSRFTPYGFCDFEDPLSSWRALHLLNGKQLRDRRLVLRAEGRTSDSIEKYKESRQACLRIKNPKADLHTDDQLQDLLVQESKGVAAAIGDLIAEVNAGYPEVPVKASSDDDVVFPDRARQPAEVFEMFIVGCIGISSLCMMLDDPLSDPNSGFVRVLRSMDTAFAILFACEMVIKVIGVGLLVGEEAYLKNGWNWLDGLVVVVGISDLVLVDSNMRFVKTLRIVRALRPLRAVSRLENLKVVITTIFKSMQDLLLVLIVAMLFIFIFATFGVQQLNGRFYHCQPPDGVAPEDFLRGVAVGNEKGTSDSLVSTPLCLGNETTEPACINGFLDVSASRWFWPSEQEGNTLPQGSAVWTSTGCAESGCGSRTLPWLRPSYDTPICVGRCDPLELVSQAPESLCPKRPSTPEELPSNCPRVDPNRFVSEAERRGLHYFDQMAQQLVMPCGGPTGGCRAAFCPQGADTNTKTGCEETCRIHPTFCAETCKSSAASGGEPSSACKECRLECEAWCQCDHYCEPLVRDAALCVEQGGKWEQQLSQNFDNIVNAVLTLFEISTTEGWLEVMYAAADRTNLYQQPKRDFNQLPAAIFFMLYIFFSNMFLINLSVGVIVDNFIREKEQGNECLMSEAQKAAHEEWVQQPLMSYFNSQKSLYGRTSLFPLTNLHLLPQWRRRCYDIMSHKNFENSITVAIVLNTVFMSMKTFQRPSTWWEDMLLYVRLLFNFLFLFEFIFKFVTLRRNYWRDPWNRFDGLCVVATWAGLLIELGGFSVGAVLSVVRIIRVARLFRLLHFFKGLNKIFMALLVSLPKLANVAVLLLLLLVLYSIVGVQLFAAVQFGVADQSALDSHGNFRTFGRALLTLFRSMTGEAWNEIMHDLSRDAREVARRGSWCTPADLFHPGLHYETLQEKCMIEHPNVCGEDYPLPYLAKIFYVTFTLFLSFVMMNIVIAVILNSYYEGKKALPDSEIIDDCIRLWKKHDPDYTMFLDFQAALRYIDEAVETLSPQPDDEGSDEEIEAGATLPRLSGCFGADLTGATLRYAYQKDLVITTGDKVHFLHAIKVALKLISCGNKAITLQKLEESKGLLNEKERKKLQAMEAEQRLNCGAPQDGDEQGVPCTLEAKIAAIRIQTAFKVRKNRRLQEEAAKRAENRSTTAQQSQPKATVVDESAPSTAADNYERTTDPAPGSSSDGWASMHYSSEGGASIVMVAPEPSEDADLESTSAAKPAAGPSVDSSLRTAEPVLRTTAPASPAARGPEPDTQCPTAVALLRRDGAATAEASAGPSEQAIAVGESPVHPLSGAVGLADGAGDGTSSADAGLSRPPYPEPLPPIFAPPPLPPAQTTQPPSPTIPPPIAPCIVHSMTYPLGPAAASLMASADAVAAPLPPPSLPPLRAESLANMRFGASTAGESGCAAGRRASASVPPSVGAVESSDRSLRRALTMFPIASPACATEAAWVPPPPPGLTTRVHDKGQRGFWGHDHTHDERGDNVE